MSVVILHNPRCSKSRETLSLLRKQGVEPEVLEYLKEAPTKAWLLHTLKLLDSTPRDLMRKNESIYKTLNLDDVGLSSDELVEAMIANPILIERPIVVIEGKKAAIGRPPENILSLF